MRKSLILVLTLALVAGLSMAAYAEVQNVKVSGDITVMGVSRNMNLIPRTAQTQAAALQDHEKAMLSITRVKVDADLTDNVIATVRLLNERYWGNEIDNTSADSANTLVSLDLAYVTLKEFLYSPLTLTVGRQELHMGSEMIVGDPDTNNAASTASALSGNNRDRDLTARKAFDALRATLNYDPLVIEGIAAKIRNATLNTLGEDNDLYGIEATYKTGKKDTVVSGYWYQRRQGRRNATDIDGAADTNTAKKVDYTDVFGARVTSMPIENLSVGLEAAMQFGKYTPTTAVAMHTVDRRAWALETEVAYDFKNMKYTPMVKALYQYFSGDKFFNTPYTTDMGAFRGWDPMFENQTTGHIFNALFNQTNAHIAGLTVSMKPVEDVTLKGEMYAYWWAKAPFDGTTLTTARDTTSTLNVRQRRDIGQELDLTATYDYTEDVQFALMGGAFFPGGTFAEDNNSMAHEVIGSMKVTF